MIMLFMILITQTDVAAKAINGMDGMGWDWISPGGVIYRATYAAYNGDFDDHGDYIGGDYDDQ